MGKRSPLVIAMLVLSIPTLFVYGSKWSVVFFSQWLDNN